MSTELQEDLMATLEKPTLTPQEASRSLVQCFVLTHREFMHDRRPDLSVEQLDAICRDLVDEEFEAQGVAPTLAGAAQLKLIHQRLSAFFDFAAEPDLNTRHSHIIDSIVSKVDRP